MVDTARVEDDEVQETAAPASNFNWKLPGRDEALFAQIIHVGQDVFLNSHANLKADKHGKGGVTYDQKAVWTNTDDGILTMLAKHPAFAGATLPSYNSVINHVGTVLAKKEHACLFKPGMEQAEPADAGTEGTKDERQLTTFQQAIIDVASLKAAAAATTAAHKQNKKATANIDSKRGQFMQDEAVRRHYGDGDGADGDDHEEAATGKATGRQPKLITVAAYCMSHPDADEEEILHGTKVPRGYELIDPSHPDQRGQEHPFDEPYLKKKAQASSPGGAAGFRTQMAEMFSERNSLKKRDLDFKFQELEERKKDNKVARKKDKMLIAMQMAFMKQQGMNFSMFDSDDDAWCRPPRCLALLAPAATHPPPPTCAHPCALVY